ncbi:MAG: carboxypeptidase-like regulatory domain-containing protein [Gemmatimonadota bacterium]
MAALLLALLPLGAPFAPAHAQVVSGSVVRPNRMPVPGAQVFLRGEDDSVVASAITSAQGRFQFTLASGGRVRLQAASLGYADWETETFDLADDAELEVVITLQFAPIPLEELRVEARRRQNTRLLADFERRREIKAFGGYFMDDEDIALRPASRPSNLPLQFPGMSVTGGVGPFDQYTIMTGDCPATVFVDGRRINQLATSVDEYLELPRIAGVEVYPRSMNAPPQYQDAGLRECGTVLFWTKELEPDDSGGWTTAKIALGLASFSGLLILVLAH